MIRALCLAATIATPALAETQPDRVTVHHDPAPGDAWFARMVIENRKGMYNRTTAYPTSHGDVTLEYVTTTPSKVGDPASADEVCVMDLPEGVAAFPICMDVMEEESGTVFLFEYLGG
jgi:hypothetical protein